MNKELEKTNGNSPVIKVGERGLEIKTFDDMWYFANRIVDSGMAPKDMQRPEAVVVALQKGYELGLKPMQSLQNIAVINGRPSVWGVALPGIVRASGLCEYIKITKIGTKPKPGVDLKDWPDDYGYNVASKRKDTGEEYDVNFTVDDAKRAGLWCNPKKDVWNKYPDRMLINRPRSYCLQDLFSDIFGSGYTVEEMKDIDPAKPENPDLDQAMSVKMQEAGLEPETASNTHDPIDTPDTTSEVEIVDPEAPEPATEGNEFDCSPGALESEQRQKETQTTMKLGGNDD